MVNHPGVPALPHLPPMLLVSKVVTVSEQQIVTEFLINGDCIYNRGEYLSEEGLIENMAQSAACAGSNGGNLQLVIPMLIAVRNLRIIRLPVVSQCIRTQIRPDIVIENIHVVLARVFCDEEVIAEGELRFLLSSVS